MNAAEIVDFLRSLGVDLWVGGERLCYSAPKGVLTKALRERIAELKLEILALLRKQGETGAICHVQSDIQAIPRGKELPLSSSQEQLWFLAQLVPDNPGYNVSAAVRLNGRFSIVALEQCLNEVSRRHESLRTVFHLKGGVPYQFILPTFNPYLVTVELKSLSGNKRDERLSRLVVSESRHPFSLSTPPLWRTLLLRTCEDEHVLVLTFHHIVCDGWSLGALVRELILCYRSFVEGDRPMLPTLFVQYADFAQWQSERLLGEATKKQLAYWERRLLGAPTVLKLPLDRPRPPKQSFRGASMSFALSEDLTEGIKRLSRQRNVTLFVTLLATFQSLLYLWSGEEDIIIGFASANRNKYEIENLVGCFVNLLVMRTPLFGEMSFGELLDYIHLSVLDIFANQDLPFEKLVERVQPRRCLGYNPLIQVCFVLQNAPMPRLEAPGLRLEVFYFERGTARFDLELSMRETEQQLVGTFTYDVELFNSDTIEAIRIHFVRLLEEVVTGPEMKLIDLLADGSAWKNAISAEASAPHLSDIEPQFVF